MNGYQPGERVRVRRWMTPTLWDKDPGRELCIEFTGTVERTSPGMLYFDPASIDVQTDTLGPHSALDYAQLGLGYVFFGGYPQEGTSRYLVTECEARRDPR